MMVTSCSHEEIASQILISDMERTLKEKDVLTSWSIEVFKILDLIQCKFKLLDCLLSENVSCTTVELVITKFSILDNKFIFWLDLVNFSRYFIFISVCQDLSAPSESILWLCLCFYVRRYLTVVP